MSIRNDIRLLRRLRLMIEKDKLCVEHKKTIHFPEHLDETGCHISVSLSDYQETPYHRLRFSGRHKDTNRLVEMPTYIAISSICGRHDDLDTPKLLTIVDKALSALANKDDAPYIKALRTDFKMKQMEMNSLACLFVLLDEISSPPNYYDLVPLSVKIIYALEHPSMQWTIAHSTAAKMLLKEEIIELVIAQHNGESFTKKKDILEKIISRVLESFDYFSDSNRLRVMSGINQAQDYYRVHKKICKATKKHEAVNIVRHCLGRQLNKPMALWLPGNKQSDARPL